MYVQRGIRKGTLTKLFNFYALVPRAWVINKKIQNCSFLRANLNYFLLLRLAGKVKQLES